MMSLSPPARQENSKVPPLRINQRDHPCALIFFMNFFLCSPPLFAVMFMGVSLLSVFILLFVSSSRFSVFLTTSLPSCRGAPVETLWRRLPLIMHFHASSICTNVAMCISAGCVARLVVVGRIIRRHERSVKLTRALPPRSACLLRLLCSTARLRLSALEVGLISSISHLPSTHTPSHAVVIVGPCYMACGVHAAHGGEALPSQSTHHFLTMLWYYVRRHQHQLRQSSFALLAAHLGTKCALADYQAMSRLCQP